MMACGLPYPRIEQGPLSPRCRIMSTERQHRRDIVSFGRALHERGYVAAMDGNLSVRLGENRILATPTAMCKGVMRTSDLVIAVGVARMRFSPNRTERFPSIAAT